MKENNPCEALSTGSGLREKLAVTSNIAEGRGAVGKVGLGGRAGLSVRTGFVQASTAPGTLEISELPVTGSTQAAMATGTKIKGQAEASGAGLHILRPEATLPHKGKERGKLLPCHCLQEKGRTGERLASLPAPPLWGHGKGPTLKLA